MNRVRPARRRGGVPPAGQHGQALVFTLAMTAAACLMALLLVKSGMLANTRTVLQNAADAGAYSAAVLQARDSNFAAYANRAMVANQISVAQLVSLASYLEDARDTRERARNFLDFYARHIPVTNPAWKVGLAQPMSSVYSAYSAMVPGAVKALDTLIAAFQNAQEIHHQATALELVRVADEVVRQYDPAARVSHGAFALGNTVIDVARWQGGMTQRHRANDSSAEADRFADVVVHDESQDAFIRNRLSIPAPIWASAVKARSCLFLAVGSSTAFGFTHAGGTLLSADKKSWLALDATQGHGYWSCTVNWLCGFVHCLKTLTFPLLDVSLGHGLGGSGGAVAGRGNHYGDSRGYRNNAFPSWLYGWAQVNPLTVVPANVRYFKGPGKRLDDHGGLQDYYRDMAAPLTRRPDDQQPEHNGGEFPIVIEVEREGAVSPLLTGSGAIRLDGALKGNTMKALAAGHSYFYRPGADNSSGFTRSGWVRSDRKTELANLFNPYWQARLVDPGLSRRLASAALQ